MHPTTLELAAEFYPLEAIERAAAAFSHVAVASIEPGGSRHRIRLEPLGDADPESVRLEFANWVLTAGASAPGA